ncbi:MAG TPA: hypothetical protein VFS12_18535 [Terriglobia bacterium]|nr:hypothetical protein [Terriglobia bacterium]
MKAQRGLVRKHYSAGKRIHGAMWRSLPSCHTARVIDLGELEL